MRKVLISVAPISADCNNINPDEVAEDIIHCAKVGASMVHLHVRDKNGNLTEDLTEMKKIVEKVRKKSNIIIQASTGGVSNLNIKQRCAPLYYDLVESTSLNVGSCNLGDSVYLNPIEDVEYCVKETLKMNKKPEIEVFEIGMINTVVELMEKFDFKNPVLFNIVLGHKGIAQATPEALFAMKSFIPKETLWGVTHANREEYNIFTTALGMGASTVRVGFEDSNYLEDGKIASKNYLIVEKVANIIRAMNLDVATPEEAREMLNI